MAEPPQDEVPPFAKVLASGRSWYLVSKALEKAQEQFKMQQSEEDIRRLNDLAKLVEAIEMFWAKARIRDLLPSVLKTRRECKTGNETANKHLWRYLYGTLIHGRPLIRC